MSVFLKSIRIESKQSAERMLLVLSFLQGWRRTWESPVSSSNAVGLNKITFRQWRSL